jgi:hypothetical protein
VITLRSLFGEDAAVRFERKVGSSRSARVGNTVTHLLEEENAQSVGVLEPTVPLVNRTEIDGAAMSLRRHELVHGPLGDYEPADVLRQVARKALDLLRQRQHAMDYRRIRVEAGRTTMLPPRGSRVAFVADPPTGLHRVRASFTRDRVDTTRVRYEGRTGEDGWTSALRVELRDASVRDVVETYLFIERR